MELERTSGVQEDLEGSDIMEMENMVDVTSKEGDTMTYADNMDSDIDFTDENWHMRWQFSEQGSPLQAEGSTTMPMEGISSQTPGPEKIYISDESDSQSETAKSTHDERTGGPEKHIEVAEKSNSAVNMVNEECQNSDSEGPSFTQPIAGANLQNDKTAEENELAVSQPISGITPFLSISELSAQLKGDQKDIRRWPPNVDLPIRELNSLLTCAICNGYFVNATTVTDCMHTFCKSCIVHHINSSLHCPRCLTLIHPSNPFLNLRHDATLQGILYKVLPHLETEERDRQIQFYRSRGLPFPHHVQAQPKKPVEKSASVRKQPRNVRLVPVHLVNAGSSPGLPKYMSLKKRYLLLPDHTTIGHIKTYVCSKLKPMHGTQVYMFIQAYLVHDSLRLQYIQKVFGLRNLQTKMIKVQYAVLPMKNYLKHGFSSLLPPAPTPEEEESAAEPVVRDTDSGGSGGIQSTSLPQDSMLLSMLTSK